MLVCIQRSDGAKDKQIGTKSVHTIAFFFNHVSEHI